jgi:hypothetical protein
VHAVFRADPQDGPLAVARIKALLEFYEDDPNVLEPAPVAQQLWSSGIALKTHSGRADLRVIRATLGIYVYEKWETRFALARLAAQSGAFVGAFLMIETQSSCAAGISSANLCQSVLARAEELTWPI